MRRIVLFGTVVLPGLSAVAVCAHYLAQDWRALIAAFTHLEDAAATGDLRRVFAAQALDHVYRLNCFAEGVGLMLGVLIFAIGVHGLCTLPEPPAHST